MTRTLQDVDQAEIWADTEEIRPPRRRVRGMRIPVLPTGSLLAQVLGGAAVLVGCFLQFGGAITLIVGGAAVALLGALKESGKI